jgi:hypothetical protein
MLFGKEEGWPHRATSCDCHWKSIKRWVGSTNVVCCSRYKTHTLLRNLQKRYLTCKEEPVTLQTRYLLLSAIRLSDLTIYNNLLYFSVEIILKRSDCSNQNYWWIIIGYQFWKKQLWYQLGIDGTLKPSIWIFAFPVICFVVLFVYIFTNSFIIWYIYIQAQIA